MSAKYTGAALCAAINSDGIRRPLNHTAALEVMARLEGARAFCHLARTPIADRLKRQAKELRAWENALAPEVALGMDAAEKIVRALSRWVEPVRPRPLQVPNSNERSVPALVTATSETRMPRGPVLRRKAIAWEEEDSPPVFVTSGSRKPKGFPSDRSESNLREYLKKYQYWHAQTAFELIMADMRERASTKLPTFDEEILIHPRIAAALGDRFWHKGKLRLGQSSPESGYYPPWHLIHALSIFFDIELDAGPAQYGHMLLKTRERPPRFLRYEIKGYRWSHEDEIFQHRLIR